MGYSPEKITDNMICAGYKEGQQDACQVYISWKYYFLHILSFHNSGVANFLKESMIIGRFDFLF